MTDWNDIRRANAVMLTSEIEGIEDLTSLKIADGVKHVFDQYVVKVEDDYPLEREELIEKLHDKDIGTAVNYPKVISEQSLYKEKGYDGREYENAYECAEKVFSIPIHPKVSENDIEYMLEVLEV